MTTEEKKEVVRVCGDNYEENDIPSYIRNRDNEKDICPECGEHRPDDNRVKAGMKCGHCAYNC